MRLSLRPTLDETHYAYTHSLRTRFAETDAMGVIHHANYLLYLEEARVAWLSEVGRAYAEVRDGGMDFAVIESFVQYRRPLRFDEVVDVHLRVGELKRTTVQIGYLLSVDGGPRATAVTVHAGVTPAGRPVRLPDWLGDPAFRGNEGTEA